VLINDPLSGYGWINRFPNATALWTVSRLLPGNPENGLRFQRHPIGAAPRIEQVLDVSTASVSTTARQNTGLRTVTSRVAAKREIGVVQKAFVTKPTTSGNWPAQPHLK
jgi:hypothetical protein